MSKLIFPSQQTAPSSPEFRDFIKQLLEYSPFNRLGHDGGPETILRHSWFSDLDLDEVYARQVKSMDKYKPVKF